MGLYSGVHRLSGRYGKYLALPAKSFGVWRSIFNRVSGLRRSDWIYPVSYTHLEDPVIALVDEDGTVTAVSEGTVKIYATAADGSNVYGYIEINVARCV